MSDQDNAVIDVEEQDLLEVDNVVDKTVADSLKLSTEALIEAYKLPSAMRLGMEAQEDSKGFLEAMAEKVKQFFKWVRELVAKVIAFFTGRKKSKEDVAKEIRDFERKYKGTDKIMLLEGPTLSTEDYNREQDADRQLSSEYQTLKTSRAAYVARKRALWIATNKICERQVYFAIQFLQKRRENAEFVETQTLVVKKMVDLVDRLRSSLGSGTSGRPLPDMTKTANEIFDEYRRVAVNIFNNNDPIKGAQEFISHLSARIRFQQASPEDLIVMVGEVLFQSVAIENDMISALSSVQKSLNDFKELEMVKRSQYTHVEAGDQVVQDYYQALALSQKVIAGAMGTLRVFAQQMVLPDQYYELSRATMNAYENVAEILRDVKPRRNSLDDQARTLLDQMTREFV